jgi:hypothetical protein
VTALFPPLPYTDWPDTLATVHRFSQVVGKLRLAHSPRRNHWWNVPFHLTGRGVTTRPMGLDPTFALEFDYAAHRLRVDTSDGRSASFGLVGHSVASFHAEVTRLLTAVGIDPSAIADAHPFDLPDAGRRFADDTEHAAYDTAAVHRYWQILAQVNIVLEEFAGRFSARRARSTTSGTPSTSPSPASPTSSSTSRPRPTRSPARPTRGKSSASGSGSATRRTPRLRSTPTPHPSQPGSPTRPCQRPPPGRSGAAATSRSWATTTPAWRPTQRRPCSTSTRPPTEQEQSGPAGTRPATPAWTAPPTPCSATGDEDQSQSRPTAQPSVVELHRPTDTAKTRPPRR